MYKNLIIVCQLSLSPKKSTKFYILESFTVENLPDPWFEECTLIGDVAIAAHIVGCGSTFNDAKKKLKQLSMKEECMCEKL